MAKTSTGLLEYARSKIGVPYVYGAKMEVLTQAKFNSLQASYGKKLVWDSDAKKIGTVCCDCSGLISSYTGVLRSSAGYKSAATKVAPISDISNAPIGALIWRQGHIGIYSGMKKGVPYYIAEDGSAHGCRETELSNNSFTHWLLCPDIIYDDASSDLEKEGDFEMRYNTVSDLPDYAKATIQKLVDKGYLAGDGTGFNLSEDMIRILVINDRVGLYQ